MEQEIRKKMLDMMKYYNFTELEKKMVLDDISLLMERYNKIVQSKINKA